LKKKLLFIWEYPFTKQHYNQFFLKYFKKFFKIQIIDCSDIFHPNKIFFKDTNFYKPKTICELEKKNLNRINYVILGGSDFFKNKLYFLLKNYRIKFIDFYITYPIFHSLRFYHLIRIILDFRITFSLNILYNLVVNKLKILKNYLNKSKDKIRYKIDLRFVSGDLAKKYFINDSNAKKIIEVCSYEYSFKPKFIYKNKFAVFLDNLTFTHPDILILNIKDKTKFSHSHFRQLNNFFNFLEKKYNFKVIIAAHPKVNLKKFKSLYPNNEIIINKTPELVFCSQFVMAHSTTSAINTAIIYKKPLIFLTTDVLETEYRYYKELLFKNTILKQPLINVSVKKNYFDFDKYHFINFKGYQEYIYKYIKSKYVRSSCLKEKILAEIVKL